MEELKKFESFLLRKGNKPSTIYRQLWSVQKVLNGIDSLNSESLELYFSSLVKSGRSGQYVNRLVCAMAVYAGFLGRDDLKVDYFAEKKTLKSTMSDQEIEAFLNLPPIEFGRSKTGKKVRLNYDRNRYHRWTRFFKICAFSGARLGEIANLTVDDIDWGLMALRIRETKTGEPRLIPIAENIIDDIRVAITESKDGFLFWSSFGGRGNKELRQNPVFDADDWNLNFHKRLKRLGIKRKGLTPYSLRHSFITRLLEEDVNLFKVQKIVGHRQIETTAQYTHMTMKDTQQAIKKHPLIRKQTDPHFILNSIKETIEQFELEKDERFKFEMNLTNNGLSLGIYVK